MKDFLTPASQRVQAWSLASLSFGYFISAGTLWALMSTGHGGTAGTEPEAKEIMSHSI